MSSGKEYFPFISKFIRCSVTCFPPIWTHVIETELKAKASDQPLLITQMPLASQEDETRMAEILMEKLAVPAMFIANKSVMSLYGGGNMTGISVDSGHDTTYLGRFQDFVRNRTMGPTLAQGFKFIVGLG